MAERGNLDWEAALARAYRAAFGVLRDAPLAEEVAQEACFKALANLDTFRGTCAFPGWVWTIAFRLALDRKKRANAVTLDPDLIEGQNDPERGVASHQVRGALQDCLSELTERQRQMFVAKHVYGLKGAEIAAELNVREGTVWATLQQAALNLRQCLGRRGIDREVLQ